MGQKNNALSRLFQQDGVPNVMVMYEENAQVQGSFGCKLYDACCYIE
jgi:hypothetical protein